MSNTTPRIYVADLAAYNSGKLHGVWIDATLSVDEMEEAIQEMLKASPVADAEEYAIHDSKGFGHLSLKEYTLEKLSEIANAIEEHGQPYLTYMEYVGESCATVDGFEESFQGEYETMADFAEQFYEDIGDLAKIPDSLRYHIDWESVARDLVLSGDYYFENGYVFRNI